MNLIEDLPVIRYGTWAGKYITKIDSTDIPFLVVHKKTIVKKQSSDFTSAKSLRTDLSNGTAVSQRQDSMVSHVTTNRNDSVANTIDVVNDPTGTILDLTWIGKATGNNQNLPSDLTLGLNKVRGTQPVMGISSQAPSSTELIQFRQDSPLTSSQSGAVAGPIAVGQSVAQIPKASDIFPKVGIGFIILILVAFYLLKGGA